MEIVKNKGFGRQNHHFYNTTKIGVIIRLTTVQFQNENLYIFEKITSKKTHHKL